MSTRAVYTFIDKENTFHVYKHCDGYPSGAIYSIQNALKLAWELPRFEADEFAASFIAANKTRSGNVYLTKHYKNHGDLDYRYEISYKNGEIYISIFDVENHYIETEDKEAEYKLIFEGYLENGLKKYLDDEK